MRSHSAPRALGPSRSLQDLTLYGGLRPSSCHRTPTASNEGVPCAIAIPVPVVGPAPKTTFLRPLGDMQPARLEFIQ